MFRHETNSRSILQLSIFLSGCYAGRAKEPVNH